MDAIKSFFGGTPALLVSALIAGMALGGWLSGIWKDADSAGHYKHIAEDSAKAQASSADSLVVLVQNAGRREMNLVWRAEADRQQCTAAIETFRQWETLSAEAKAAQSKRTMELEARLKALSEQYAKLVKSYEGADRTTTGWLNSDVPMDLCIVRYGAACRADPFAAAGYPEPPAREGAVAGPPRR